DYKRLGTLILFLCIIDITGRAYGLENPVALFHSGGHVPVRTETGLMRFAQVITVAYGSVKNLAPSSIENFLHYRKIPSLSDRFSMVLGMALVMSCRSRKLRRLGSST